MEFDTLLHSKLTLKTYFIGRFHYDSLIIRQKLTSLGHPVYNHVFLLSNRL